MKIVVDIPKETYEALVINQYCGSKSNLENIIVNGIPLPEHHGDLIDANKLMERFENEQYYYDKSESPLDELSIAFDNGIICAMEKLDEAPTIIEGSESE